MPQRQKSLSGAMSTISTNQRPDGPRIVVNVVVAWACLSRSCTWKSCLPPARSRGRSSMKLHDTWSSLHWMTISRFSSSSRPICSRAGPLLVPHTADMVWRSCALTARMKSSTASLADAAPEVEPGSAAGAGAAPASGPDRPLEHPPAVRASITKPAITSRLRTAVSSAALPA